MGALKETYRLSNGVEIPKIGFGTWQIEPGKNAYNAVEKALRNGYRHIDTAHAYQNEKSVGEAIKDSGIPRDEIFVTSKLRAEIKDYDLAIQHFNETLDNLGLDYLDLYLIHAPWPWSEMGKDCKDGNAAVWKAIIEFYESGKIRAIGVSNFGPSDIDYIVKKTTFVPHVNQISFFVGNKQEETYAYCQKHNIFIEAYSPLGIGYALKNPIIIEMAKKYGVSPAQICIRYCLEKGTAPLPKSVHEERIVENTKVDFKIQAEDLAVLDQVKDDPRRW